MALVAEARRQQHESDAVDALVARLHAAFGERLRAVWLYETRPESGR
jgi:hypothetical protein